MTFIGRRWDEPRLIGLGYAFEQATLVRVPPTFLASTSLDAARGAAKHGVRPAVVPDGHGRGRMLPVR